MKDFHTLIKVQKFYVDQQRLILAQKQAEADAILLAITTLQANLELEKMKAPETPDGQIAIGAFIKSELARHKRLQYDLSAKEREIDNERAKLAGLFEELKRYEIAQENRDIEERKEFEKRENFDFDEQAGQRAYKNREE